MVHIIGWDDGWLAGWMAGLGSLAVQEICVKPTHVLVADDCPFRGCTFFSPHSTTSVVRPATQCATLQLWAWGYVRTRTEFLLWLCSTWPHRSPSHLNQVFEFGHKTDLLFLCSVPFHHDWLLFCCTLSLFDSLHCLHWPSACPAP